MIGVDRKWSAERQTDAIDPKETLPIWYCDFGPRDKAGIVVPSKDKLPTVIDTLIAAVRAGELDELFSQAAKTGAIGKARKAA